MIHWVKFNAHFWQCLRNVFFLFCTARSRCSENDAPANNEWPIRLTTKLNYRNLLYDVWCMMYDARCPYILYTFMQLHCSCNCEWNEMNKKKCFLLFRKVPTIIHDILFTRFQSQERKNQPKFCWHFSVTTAKSRCSMFGREIWKNKNKKNVHIS